MQAAFFDVDKTVIARSSMVAFAPAFRREGLLTRRTMARGLWTQLLFVRFGAGAKKLARLQRSVLTLTRGWDQELVRRVVASELDAVILPLAFTDALDAMARHRAEGHRIYLVSAAPEEVVGPLADRLGLDGAIASQAEIDDHGRYTGHLHRYVSGVAKAEAVAELARRDGVDLARSWAYSDSVTDLPMLEAVGHPVAVNPDRALRRAATASNWDILHFRRLGPLDAAPSSEPMAISGKVAHDAVTSRAGAGNIATRTARRWAVPVLATLAATTGGVTAWKYLRPRVA